MGDLSTSSQRTIPPDGWPRTTEAWVRYQVRAVYEALRARQIGYAVERWDSRPPHQVIRTHDEILDANGIGGPCTDLVVLMAACLQAVGIQPLVVLVESRHERHAILGYRLVEQIHRPRTPAEEIRALLDRPTLHQLEQGGVVEFVNCTGITRGENVCFQQARKQGKKYLEHWDVMFALDVVVGHRTAERREIQAYLDWVREEALTLPAAFGFPPDRNFPEIRVQVKVRTGQRPYSQAEAEAREMTRRLGAGEKENLSRVCSGFPWSGEQKEDEGHPLDWDRQVRGRINRAVILGDPGFGKTWLLKHEALRLAKQNLTELEKHKEYPLAEVQLQLPVLVSLAQLASQAAMHGCPLPLDEALLAVLEERYKLGRELELWIRRNLGSERCAAVGCVGRSGTRSS